MTEEKVAQAFPREEHLHDLQNATLFWNFTHSCSWTDHAEEQFRGLAAMNGHSHFGAENPHGVLEARQHVRHLVGGGAVRTGDGDQQP